MRAGPAGFPALTGARPGRHPSRRPAFTLGLLLLLLLAGAGDCLATERQAEATLRESTWKALDEARMALEGGRPAEAEAILANLLPRTRDVAFEYAVVRQAQGYLFLQHDRLHEALDAFRDSLGDGRLPPNVVVDVRHQIARTHLLLEQYAEALQALEAIPAEALRPESHLLRGHALFRLERYGQAVTELTAAVAAGDPAPLEWRELLLAACLEAGQLPRAAQVLKQLIESEPTRAQWWRQLAGVYQRLGAHRAAAAVLAAGHHIAPLEGPALLDLVRLFLHTQQPLRAATLLENAWAQGHLQATEESQLLHVDACILARDPERAISRLEAMNTGRTAQLRARLGRLQFTLGRWQAAWENLSLALHQGGSGGQIAQDTLLAGIAALRAGHRGEAIDLLQRASSFPSTGSPAAQWLERARSEQATPG